MTSATSSDDAYRPSLGSRFMIAFMRGLGRLPLRWVRALGWLLGQVLYTLARRRRHIALVNWRLCFPQDTPVQARRAIRRHFVYFAQSWLDRGWLWEAPPEVVRRRLRLLGDLSVLDNGKPTILFAAHFLGMDAGWTALTANVQRKFCGIYTRQVNPDIDRWIFRGRKRFGVSRDVAKSDGFRPLVAALRAGEPIYILPDMDFGPRDSVFVPFFGNLAATVPSLSRLARMGRAQVVPVISRMTDEGYDVTVMAPWADFPSDDVVADTARMNHELEAYIRTMPEQYYWVHKRFKTRPEGEPYPYGRR
jgi:KDO2-lipid IV(A) lauroyltransferase